MQSVLDKAITDAAAAEATYNADVDAVTKIQDNIQTTQDSAKTAIEAATAPLAPAQAQSAADTATYKDKLKALAKIASDLADTL